MRKMRTILEPETFERLEGILEEIKKRADDGATIVVEGKKDEAALRELGVYGEFERIPSGGKSLLNSIEDLSECEEVIILTDFDSTGEDLAEFSKKHLEKLGINVLFRLRNRLKSCLRKAVKDIEGMSSFIQAEREGHARDSLESD